MNDVNTIGWETVESLNEIKQGSNGTQTVTLTFVPGAEPSTYVGWTCVFKLAGQDGNIAVSLSPTVTGDSGAKTLAFDLVYVPATTANLAPGIYEGDATLIEPSIPPKQWLPFKTYQLEVIGSASA